MAKLPSVFMFRLIAARQRRNLRTLFFIHIFCFFFTSQIFASSLPQASLKISPIEGTINKTFVFDASDSQNIDGTKSNLEYRFNFGQDVDFRDEWTQWSYSPVASFCPKNYGSFSPRKKAQYFSVKTGRFIGKVQVRDKNTRRIITNIQSYKILSEDIRNAKIKIYKKNVRVGEPIFFELLLTLPKSEDPENVKVRWDFDSDGFFETNFSTQKLVSHVFSQNNVGKTSPTAEVIFGDGESEIIRGEEKYGIKNATQLNVLRPSLQAPVLKIFPGPNVYDEETPFVFDISDSEIPKNTWIEWSFDGQYFIRGNKKFTKKFQTPGTHQVRVRICYNYNSPICKETISTVNIKQNPLNFRADIRVQNKTRTGNSYNQNSNIFLAQTGEILEFRAEIKNFYGKNTNFFYQWDFDNDSIPDTSYLSKNSIENIFEYPGIYDVRVNILNSKGIQNTAQVKVKIIKNIIPEGTFITSPLKIHTNEVVNFIPKFFDTNNHSLKTRFDFYNDGIWETDFRSSQVEWKFYKAEKVPVKMQILDEKKNVNTIVKTIEIFDPSPPIPIVEISNKYGTIDTNFIFDASKTEGQNLKFLWEFKKEKFQNSRISKKFTTTGKKIVYLTITNKFRLQTKLKIPVFVTE